jgi:ABC-type transport system substrate-binding protein
MKIVATIILVIIVILGATGYYYSTPTMVTSKPFANKDFRLGMQYAFDYKTFIDTVYNGLASQGRGPIPQTLMPYPDLFQYSYNPELAKTYFLKAKDAGAYVEGLPITIYYNSGNEVRKQGSLLLKDGIEKLDVGISVTVQELDWPTFLAKMRTKELPVFFTPWAPDYADPDDYAIPFAHGRYGTYAIRIGYNNYTVNNWIDEAARELDPAKRVEWYKAVEKQLVADAPYIWTAEPMIIECHRDWVKNWYFNPMYGEWSTAPAAFGMYKDPSAPHPDTFVHSTIGDVDSMDPAWDYESFGGGITELTMQGLVYYDRATLNIVPQLAKSWNISSDGLVYRFNLDERATFNDGSPLTADAVKFSLDRLVLMNDPDGPAWMFSSIIKGGPEYMSANTWQVTNQTEVDKYLAAEGVKVIDAHTVELTLDHQYAALLPVLAYDSQFIINPAIVNANEVDKPGFHNEWASKHGTEAGSGPYKLTEWTPKQRIVLERNKNYWGPPPKFEQIIFQEQDEYGPRQLAIMAGDVDSISLPTLNVYDFVDKDTWTTQGKIVSTKPGIIVEAHPSLNTVGIGMNLDWTTTYQVPKQFPGILMPFIVPAISVFGIRRNKWDE